MRRFRGLSCASFVLAVLAITAPASFAGADINFGMYAPIGDDGSLFFSISSRHFGREREVVTDWGRRFPNPDDLTVFLHVCEQSRLEPELVYRYRRMGLSWYEVGVRVGLPAEVWYVPVERDPGPPFGKAYGYRRNHHRDTRPVRLNDRQVRDLVSVRMAHEYYGVSPEIAMNWRRDGCDARTMMTREYRSRHRGYGRHDADRRDDHRHHDRSHDRHDDHRGDHKSDHKRGPHHDRYDD